MQTFEKNYKNYKLLGTDSVIKKFRDCISVVTLYCVTVLYFILVFVTKYRIVI